MFTITCDGKILMDLKKHIVLTSPKLEMSENAAGSLSFDIAPDHPLFDAIEMMVSEIIVYRDGAEIWSGRPVEVHTSFLGMRSIYCEGALAYLCDTVQEPSETHDNSMYNVQNWLSKRLQNHNTKAPASRRFYAGTVTVMEPDTLYRYTNYETTLECINEKLIKRLGGHLRIRRRAAGGFYLDYLEDYPHTAQQTIRFGLNLLEYSRTLTRADIATVCLPLGTRLEEKDFQALDKYLDIKEVNNGSLYVESAEGIAAFGRIIKVVHWDDVATPQTLKSKAQKWLSDAQYDDLKLEVNALDFHLADNSIPAIELLDEVRVVSPPHGLDKYYPVTKLNIPLDNPAGMVFTLGTSERVSLTTKTNAAISAIDEDLEYLPSSILLQAKANASDLIINGALGGHVVVLPDEIYISDKDDIDAAKKMWRWNLAGLGYSKTGRTGEFGTAITMDGKIVADYITTGLMSADRMRGGTLALGGTAYKNGKIEVYNASGEKIGIWDVSGLNVTKGRISGTGITLGGAGTPGSITVNNAQNEPIGYWTVNGITIKKGSISGSSLTVGGKESGGTGSITIKSENDAVLGTFNKDGITITKGAISGTALTLGGKGSGTGGITVLDSSGDQIGSWGRTGLSVLKGAISGTSISGGTITGTKVSLGGKTGGDGALTVYDADGTQIGKWDKNGINLSRSTIKGGAISGGTIKGTAISGSTITGGTVTGSKLIAGGSNAGSITVQGADGTTIGSWTKTGLTIKKGSITGASITVGGKNNGNGAIVVKDASNTTVGKWDNSGIVIKKGSITGTNIIVGGSSSSYAYISVKKGSSEAVRMDYEGFSFPQGDYTTYIDAGTTDSLKSLTIRTEQKWQGQVSSLLNVIGTIKARVRSSDTSPTTITGGKVETYGILHGGCLHVGSYNWSNNQQEGFIRCDDLTAADYVRCESLVCSGTKSRSVETETYGNRLMYCYEMPSPMFGDIGEAATDENGEAVIEIDDTFSEATRTDLQYQVFLQKQGNGDLWIEEKTPFYFVVKGTPDLRFSWEIKGKQAGYETERLEETETLMDDNEIREYQAREVRTLETA